ncbi:SMI1/KNR4 family protein [Chamaesiphon polymorphus]|nr:SMI1/KNR4 family protein [Chamaesiphon polymorphus]
MQNDFESSINRIINFSAEQGMINAIDINDFELSINKIIDFSAEQGMINAIDIKGMTLHEISCFEKKFNISLPVVYKKFISLCGNNGGRLIDESLIYSIPQLVSLPEEVQEMIEEDTYDPIPKNALFFASDRGVVYWYFICDNTPDPLVWLISEGHKQHLPNLPIIKLSDFIISELKRSVEDFIIRRSTDCY